jgi:hypothetical protein
MHGTPDQPACSVILGPVWKNVHPLLETWYVAPADSLDPVRLSLPSWFCFWHPVVVTEVEQDRIRTRLYRL